MGNKVNKIVEKFKRTQAGHSYKDCEKVLIFLGYKLRKSKSSHCLFSKGAYFITIANHKPISKDAIKDVLEAWEKEND